MCPQSLCFIQRSLWDGTGLGMTCFTQNSWNANPGLGTLLLSTLQEMLLLSLKDYLLSHVNNYSVISVENKYMCAKFVLDPHDPRTSDNEQTCHCSPCHGHMLSFVISDWLSVSRGRVLPSMSRRQRGMIVGRQEDRDRMERIEEGEWRGDEE